MRESVRPMGIEIDPEPAAESAEADAEPKAKHAKGSKARKAAVHNPVRRVHFASFIVQ
jgi:flagellar protein FliL